MKGYRTPGKTSNNNKNNGGTAVATTSGLTQDQLEMIQDITQDVDILRKKVKAVCKRGLMLSILCGKPFFSSLFVNNL